MKILTITLIAAVIGAIVLTIAWVLFGYLVVFPAAGQAWSGQEVFIIAPSFAVFGAIIGAVMGAIIGVAAARDKQDKSTS